MGLSGGWADVVRFWGGKVRRGEEDVEVTISWFVEGSYGERGLGFGQEVLMEGLPVPD